MKRSEINRLLEMAKGFMHRHGFVLPPFAYWSPEQWRSRGPEYREIAQAHLGWDITDFGGGDFDSLGLLLFTLRNGIHPIAPGAKDYAEKIMMVGEKQITPTHFHHYKMEDIINRGGGRLVIKLWNADGQDGLDDTPVKVSTDGVTRVVPAGGQVALSPGESITLPPRLYHRFWAEGGMTLVGEVSRVNDDHTDNRFNDPVGRFPAIEEDQPPVHLLVMDYHRYYSFAKS